MFLAKPRKGPLNIVWTEHSRSQSSQYVACCSPSSVSMYSLDEELTFVHPDDVDLYNAWDSRAFELQVANHELLGHGTGKLFEEDSDGKKNFDPAKACWTLLLGCFLTII